MDHEVRLFKLRHPGRPVIPLIVGGTPGDAELECFPIPLRFKLDANAQTTGEPIDLLAADAREEADGKNLALAKIVAGLLGLSSDEVFRRAERERRSARRRTRRVQAVMTGLALLLVAAGVGWLQQDYIREQYYWVAVMGPSVLTVDQELALKPGDEFKECATVCPTMTVVPAGKFLMGSQREVGPPNEHPQHAVTIAQPFAVGKYEVTFAQWDACVNAGGCPPVSDTQFGRGDRPVSGANWDEAKQYVAWLSRFTGKTYRLLSEAEWEYAARAGRATLYSFGDNPAALGDYGWFESNSEVTTHPVGEKKPNALGLYDMYGNVREWVEDRRHSTYEGAPTDGSAWTNGSERSFRGLRGGSFNDPPDELRSAYRLSLGADYRFIFNGFRIARTLTP